MRCKTIYVVTARRGDYSDRTEYAVCWFTRESDAKKRAEWMTSESMNQRRICADADAGKLYGDAWDAARETLGDPQWSPGDDTEYTAEPLERGATP